MVSITETELRQSFAVRVYDVAPRPFDNSALISSRAGIRRMIAREEYAIEKEVDPVIIQELKDRVKRLRTIRNELKRHLKKPKKHEKYYS